MNLKASRTTLTTGNARPISSYFRPCPSRGLGIFPDHAGCMYNLGLAIEKVRTELVEYWKTPLYFPTSKRRGYREIKYLDLIVPTTRKKKAAAPSSIVRGVWCTDDVLPTTADPCPLSWSNLETQPGISEKQETIAVRHTSRLTYPRLFVVPPQQLGRYSEAKDLYLQALRGKPSMGNAHLNLGNIAFRMDNWTETIFRYERWASWETAAITPG